MNWLVDGFLSWPVWGRVACVVFVVLGILWGLLGKQMLWILSCFPFLLRKLFQLLYIAVEFPVSLLHKKFGAPWYRLENQMSRLGNRLDSLLQRWYHAWHHPQKRHLLAGTAAYLALVLWLGVVPNLAGSLDSPIATGQRAYLKSEASFVAWLEDRGWYVSRDRILQESVFIQIGNRHILQNGAVIESEQAPVTRNEKTFVPLRTIVDALGGAVEWDTETQSTVVRLNGKEMRLSTASQTALVDGQEIELTDRPVELKDRIYVGVREVLDLMGYSVAWNGKDEIMMISGTIHTSPGSSLFEEVAQLLG